MEIFRRILLPISSEFYSEGLIQRAAEFKRKFGGEVIAVYIVEEKTIRRMEEVSEPFLTEEQRKEMEKNIFEKSKEMAEIIFSKAEEYLQDFQREISIGEFSDVILEKMEKHGASCIMIGFEKDCMLKYRFLERVKIPVWVEIGKGENILGVCSNLAPNIKVPSFTIKFAEAMEKRPYLLYIIDTSEMVEVDENCVKKPCSMERLMEKAKEFKEKYEHIARIEIRKGGIEEEAANFADEINADVAIVGREMKKRGIFSKEFKKEMAEKIKHSLLFLN